MLLAFRPNQRTSAAEASFSSHVFNLQAASTQWHSNLLDQVEWSVVKHLVPVPTSVTYRISRSSLVIWSVFCVFECHQCEYSSDMLPSMKSAAKKSFVKRESLSHHHQQLAKSTSSTTVVRRQWYKKRSVAYLTNVNHKTKKVGLPLLLHSYLSLHSSHRQCCCWSHRRRRHPPKFAFSRDQQCSVCVWETKNRILFFNISSSHSLTLLEMCVIIPSHGLLQWVW